MRSNVVSIISHDELVSIIKSCKNKTEVVIKLGLPPKGGNFNILNKRIKDEQIDCSHFTRYIPSPKNRIPDELIFRKGYRSNGPSLRNRFRKTTEYKCTECGLTNLWNNKPISLQLDHINGDNMDNRIENLRWLCPNCHSQTPLYAGRGQKRVIFKKLEKIGIENLRINERFEIHQERKNIILNSGIDFSKFGWIIKLAHLVNKTPQYTRNWIIANMKDFYDEKCFKNNMVLRNKKMNS